MFMLYAIPLGLIVGLLVGGRFASLSTLSFRWGWLALAGFLLQVVLFTPRVAAGLGDLDVPLYLGSMVVVLAVMLANARLPGLPIVAFGAALNLLVITVNGGYMPASAEAYAAHGIVMGDGYANTRLMADPVLAPLSDVISLPTWLPLTNVISVGDLLIATGTASAIAFGMRGGVPRQRSGTMDSPAGTNGSSPPA